MYRITLGIGRHRANWIAQTTMNAMLNGLASKAAAQQDCPMKYGSISGYFWKNEKLFVSETFALSDHPSSMLMSAHFPIKI